MNRLLDRIDRTLDAYDRLTTTLDRVRWECYTGRRAYAGRKGQRVIDALVQKIVEVDARLDAMYAQRDARVEEAR